MITIIDYQMGNLRSVQKAFESVGAEAKITSDPQEIAQAEKLVLPGVGGFGEAMEELRSAIWNRRFKSSPLRDVRCWAFVSGCNCCLKPVMKAARIVGSASSRATWCGLKAPLTAASAA